MLEICNTAIRCASFKPGRIESSHLIENKAYQRQLPTVKVKISF